MKFFRLSMWPLLLALLCGRLGLLTATATRPGDGKGKGFLAASSEDRDDDVDGPQSIVQAEPEHQDQKHGSDQEPYAISRRPPYPVDGTASAPAAPLLSTPPEYAADEGAKDEGAENLNVDQEVQVDETCYHTGVPGSGLAITRSDHQGKLTALEDRVGIVNTGDGDSKLLVGFCPPPGPGPCVARRGLPKPCFCFGSSCPLAAFHFVAEALRTSSKSKKLAG